MTELSPAAQAVADAYAECADPYAYDTSGLIAALRALADQVVPEEPDPTGMRPCGEVYSNRENQRRQRQETRRQILAIANEIENYEAY